MKTKTQCVATTKTGNRCQTNATDYSAYCHVHVETGKYQRQMRDKKKRDKTT